MVDQRVTNALLNHKLENLTENVKTLHGDVKDGFSNLGDRMQELEKWRERHDTIYDYIEDSVIKANEKADKAIEVADAASRDSTRWNMFNSIGVVIANILGSIGMLNK
jgi:hypothetical protein